MKYFLCLLLLAASSARVRAAEGPCDKYLRPGYQRDVFLPEWEKRASPMAKKFLAGYAASEKPAAVLEMQCLLSAGMSRIIKNENDATVEWARDHKNIRPSKGQDDLDAAGAALRDFRKGRDPNTLSPGDKAKLDGLKERVQAAQSQLSKFKGLCNEWTQSVCSAFTFPAKHHNVRWIEIHWDGLDANEATHNMVAICPKDVEDPFARRGRCLLIDAWRNLDRDHDIYAFHEYHDMGVSRTQKTCPDGKTIR